jgi:hypothetical protein
MCKATFLSQRLQHGTLRIFEDVSGITLRQRNLNFSKIFGQIKYNSNKNNKICSLMETYAIGS